MASKCRECGNAKRRALHGKDRDGSRLACRKWYANNLDNQREYRKLKQADPAHRANKAKAQRLRKARLRSGQPNSPEIAAIYALAIKEEKLIQPCPVFDLPELGKKLHVDHIIPLAKGGPHLPSNLQILPAGLNMRKGVKCQK